MFKPRHLKRSKHFRKGVEKFVNYKRHLLKGEDVEAIRAGVRELQALEKERADEEKIKEKQDAIEKQCRKALPGGVKEPGWLPENIEVLFTAIVIALGIRAYFLQPFKIPTGSMQPTLNGVIAERMADGEVFPNPASRAGQWLFNSRRYFEVKAPSSGHVIDWEDRNFLLFFTWTEFVMDNGQRFKVPAPFNVAVSDLGMQQYLPRTAGPEPRVVKGARRDLIASGQVRAMPIEKGQVLTRGWVQGGDHLLVDKMSYHFRRPKRGEVFVFNTKGLRGIETGESFREEFGSQHYIKRLVGVPGDHLEITSDGRLLVNGEPAKEPGMQRVMSKEDGYLGYQRVPGLRQLGGAVFNEVMLEERFWPKAWRDVRVAQPVYFACGDNQGSSLDSRFWGPVPQVNVVGPAFVVYWPFGNHLGLIR